MDGQVTFRPVMEDDLSWLASLTSDPAAIGPYEWHGWSDPQRLRRSWAESGLLGDDGGVLIVLHGTDRVGVVDWHKVQTGRTASNWTIGIGLAPEFRGRGYGSEAVRRSAVRLEYPRVTASAQHRPADRARNGHNSPFVPNCGAAGPLVRQPESSTIRSMPFHQGNMMSNKPHLRPHQKKQQANQITRLVVAILILAIFALGIALELTGRVVFRGRLMLTERLAASPHARDQAAPSCPICAAGKPAVRWQRSGSRPVTRRAWYDQASERISTLSDHGPSPAGPGHLQNWRIPPL